MSEYFFSSNVTASGKTIFFADSSFFTFFSSIEFLVKRLVHERSKVTIRQIKNKEIVGFHMIFAPFQKVLE